MKKLETTLSIPCLFVWLFKSVDLFFCMDVSTVLSVGSKLLSHYSIAIMFVFGCLLNFVNKTELKTSFIKVGVFYSKTPTYLICAYVLLRTVKKETFGYVWSCEVMCTTTGIEIKLIHCTFTVIRAKVYCVMQLLNYLAWVAL